jgi:hypothetical protein
MTWTFDTSVHSRHFGRELVAEDDVDVSTPTTVADGLGTSVGVDGLLQKWLMQQERAEGDSSVSLNVSTQTGIAAPMLALLNTVHAVVVAVDSGFKAFHGSDHFVQFQMSVLAAVSAVTFVDVVFDLRRFPPTVSASTEPPVRFMLTLVLTWCHCWMGWTGGAVDDCSGAAIPRAHGCPGQCVQVGAVFRTLRMDIVPFARFGPSHGRARQRGAHHPRQ